MITGAHDAILLDFEPKVKKALQSFVVGAILAGAERRAMQFRCKHCEKLVEKGSPTTAIISGTLGEASLDEFKNFYVFHDTCFVEVGGEEYSPAYSEAAKKQAAPTEKEERLTWF